MSNQPEQPQPYTGAPPGYHAPAVPPMYQGPEYPTPQTAPYGAPAYYQGGPGYMAASGPRALSLTSMILGLTSLILLGWLIAPQIVGIVLGHLGLRKENPQGRAFAITGLVTSYLALVIWGGLVAFLIIGFAFIDSYSGY